MITHFALTARFDYHESGWLIRRSTDKPLGYSKERYIKAKIDCKEYYVHQLIWFWHRGIWAPQIDHIDRGGFNNRIENLREATQSQNNGNANWGPMRGIEKHGRKFRVRIAGVGWKKELGSYLTLEEAKAARDAGHREYWGEFANV